MQIETAPRLRSVDVARLLRIDDPQDWGGGLVLRSAGVHRRESEADRQAWRMLSPEERAAIGEPGELVLPLPCTIDELERFVKVEGLRDGYIERRLRLLKVIAAASLRDDATSPEGLTAGQRGTQTRPPQKMEWNRQRVLQALRDSGFDPLALPSMPKGRTCPAKAAARDRAGLGKAAFDHAWSDLSESGGIRRTP